MSLKKLIVSIAGKASGNKFVQDLLKKNILFSQYFMGIGSGQGVLTSGEEAVFDLLTKTSKPPYCIFDVGANKGQFLNLAISKLKTADFNIHSFEPGHETFEILKVNGTDKRVKLNNTGIGKTTGEMTLHYDTPGSGLASLTKRKLDHFNIDFSKSETVQINTIDNYCQENNISKINLLKIDIEGHELDALLGAEKMFSKKAVDIVTFEFGGCNIDTRTYFQDFWYFFAEAGLKIFRITPSGYMYPINSYSEIEEQFRTINYLAVREV